MSDEYNGVDLNMPIVTLLLCTFYFWSNVIVCARGFSYPLTTTFFTGSRAYDELEKVVKGRLLLKDIKRISPAEQTSGLEAFHKVLCHFAPKLVHYFHAQMEAR